MVHTGSAFRALSDPRRREILQMIQPQERSVGQIAAEFSVSRPAISQHLAVLDDAGLVDIYQVGTRRYYRARPEGMEEMMDYLSSFWTTNLADLKDQIEELDNEVPE